MKQNSCAAWTLALLLLAGCGTAGNTRQPAPPPEDAGPDARGLEEVVVTGVAQEEAARMQAARVNDRKLVRTAQLVLTVDDEEDFPETLERAEALAKDAEGYVAEARTDALVLRVPNERLEAVLDALGALGEVDQRSVRTIDVTAQYTDLDIQIENTRAFRNRLRVLRVVSLYQVALHPQLTHENAAARHH